jgi:hypothetical protein
MRHATSRVRLKAVAVILVVTCGWPAAPAAADWLLVPFAGSGFGGATTFLLDGGTRSAQTVFGISGTWLSDQIFGFEAEVMHGSTFFEPRGGASLVSDSYVTTVSGGVVAAMPLSVTRESPRPYVTGGIGALQADIDYALGIFAEHRTLAALHVGGGAMGFVSHRTGYRFDARYVRSLSREEDQLTGNLRTKLSFWRVTVGVLLRIG